MPRLTSNLVAAAVLGQVIGTLGWIDPLFVPFVLLGPVVTGAVLGARRVGYAWVALLWGSTGLSMTWQDWVVNHEDVGFHLATAVVMPALAAIGYGVARLAARSRATA